jgi:hypothetical protein
LIPCPGSAASKRLAGTAGQGRRINTRVADVLIDDAGADVGDFGALGELVDNEGVKVLVASDGDVQEEVLVAGDDEDAQGLGQLRGPVAERLKHLAFGRPDADRDESLDGPADAGEVDVKQGAADDAALAQAAGAVQGGGGRDADGGGDVAVGAPCVRLQFPQDGRIKFV